MHDDWNASPGIELQGLLDVTDEGPRESIRLAAERSLGKLRREFDVERLQMRFKGKHSPGSKRTRFSVTAHLRTHEHAVVGKAEGWDLVKTTEAALRELERRAMTHHVARVARQRARQASPVRSTA